MLTKNVVTYIEKDEKQSVRQKSFNVIVENLEASQASVTKSMAFSKIIIHNSSIYNMKRFE